MTGTFAYSHLWQFTTIDSPNNRKMREKDNQREQLIESGAGEGAEYPGCPGAKIKAF